MIHSMKLVQELSLSFKLLKDADKDMIKDMIKVVNVISDLPMLSGGCQLPRYLLGFKSQS